MLENAHLNKDVVSKLMCVLHENQYAQVLRRLQNCPLELYGINICTDVKLDQRVYDSPSADQVVRIWIEGNNESAPYERDIVVHAHSGKRHRIKHCYGCYDPLQHPLLFPKIEFGWHQTIMKNNYGSNIEHFVPAPGDRRIQMYKYAEEIFSNEQQDVTFSERKKVSCRQYYSYKLQIRVNDPSILLLSANPDISKLGW